MKHGNFDNLAKNYRKYRPGYNKDLLNKIFKEEEIQAPKYTETEKKNFGDKTDLYILDWCKDEFQNNFLEKIIIIINNNTGLNKDYLRRSFTKKV